MMLTVMESFRVIVRLLGDVVAFLWLRTRPASALAAENLFLRKQLAMYRERGVKPRRPDPATRVALVLLSHGLNWKDALAVVRPRTFTRWHRLGFRLLWRLKSRPGRRPIPVELRRLIREMAMNNGTWGEERIANELLLKLGLRVSPRTVRKYMPPAPRRRSRDDQRWSTFVRNHAQAIVACDFCVVVTATFRMLYVFLVIEHQTRRILHSNVTAHPTAPWTLQQLREAIPSDHAYRFLIHDRDSIFSRALDRSIRNLGLRVLKTPYRTPQANALCERVIGSLRRECLGFLIPFTEAHLRGTVRSWVQHYNEGRPHMALGPSFPEPPMGLPVSLCSHRHRIPADRAVKARPILGGLHHEYFLERKAA